MNEDKNASLINHYFHRGVFSAVASAFGNTAGGGAVFRDSNADLCAVFPFLPRYPVIVKMWFADEEFPASGKMLVSGGADHYLTIEDAVTVGEVMFRRLEETWRRLYMADHLSDPESERTPALRG